MSKLWRIAITIPHSLIISLIVKNQSIRNKSLITFYLNLKLTFYFVDVDFHHVHQSITNLNILDMLVRFKRNVCIPYQCDTVFFINKQISKYTNLNTQKHNNFDSDNSIHFIQHTNWQIQLEIALVQCKS